MNPIQLKDYEDIVVLTGAGVSAGSGLKTYRGQGGLWNERDTQRLSSFESLVQCPDLFWKFWGPFRKTVREAEPNKAHIALANWESRISGKQKFTLITQNVDNLHQRAGSKNVVEIHGNLLRTRCSNRNCSSPTFADTNSYENGTPSCSLCGSVLRPDFVLFGEMLPLEAERNCKMALRHCGVFIAVGTSGTVSPAAGFVDWAKYAGAKTVLVNLEKMEPRNPSFDCEYLGKAEDILPALLK